MPVQGGGSSCGLSGALLIPLLILSSRLCFGFEMHLLSKQ